MKLTDYLDADNLTATERRVIAVCQRINERPGPQQAQRAFHERFSRHWIRWCTTNLLEVAGLAHVHALLPDAGVLLCANHRSFFDLYVVGSILRDQRLPWVVQTLFPVRTEFFYDTWTGLAVNLLMGGGAMYPPIFRDRAKAELNKLSIQRVIDLLGRPGVVVGMHPEGTRGKGPDPYQLLRAQPGVGQMALQSSATVLPVWVIGLGNEMAAQILSNFRNGGADGRRIRVVFGPPVDLSDLRHERRRITLYKRASDRILEAIRDLGEHERALPSARP